ncbi:MAG: hypothetical protein ABMA26_12110 [Limisphaerales bacterium]
MQKSSPKQARGELVREEWDFRARPTQRKRKQSTQPPKRAELAEEDAKKFERFGFLPDDQVLACWDYERARLDAKHAKQIQGWRSGAEEQSFPALLHLRQSRYGKEERTPWEFYAYWPEWPNLPFLKVPEAERRKRWERWTARSFDTSPALPSVCFHYLLGHAEWIPDRGEDKPWAGEFAHSRIDPQAGVITFDDKGADLPPGFRWRSDEEIAAFRVNFSQPDETLASQFKRWLCERRAQNGIPSPNVVGERSQIQQTRKELVTLGVWRLVALGCMSYTAAEDYTEAVAGKALCSGKAGWSNNFRRATGEDGGFGIALTAHWHRTRGASDKAKRS